MKRLYEIRVTRYASTAGKHVPDYYEFNVVSDSPVKAMSVALKRAGKASGYPRIWRCTKLTESEMRVIS